MKMSNDTGPQVLPTSFGPSVKVGLDSGPQINGGPNGGFTPTMKPGEDFTGPQIFHGGAAAGPAQFGRANLVRERTSLPTRSRFFPAVTGMGGASVRAMESYQGGPAGRMNPYRVRSGWTWGM